MSGPNFAVNAVIQNEDLLWIVTSFLTGFESSRATSTEQRPCASTSTSAAPILPLLLTFRSLRRERMQEMGIPLVSLKSQFITSVSMVEWAISMGCVFRGVGGGIYLSEVAAGRGLLEVLQWLRAQDP
eukprot:CAMPEP_0114466100 /NCGR_PEP_ID=MMETSP0104-20121206/8877_1 /TAXON_ID=37642 ORGANISM="Paraphysomonas imperforata, Strain PA2" /NCGR_SAMPLE_ID=MMETSP0104 /ASSEMBLY_ACC=CAM_ASM_000202 /LENGTH=127 /DNA_ID=CAMNT_0001639413 /DNA_START=83 /DNA_END=462 /DNA_ORIENTATION=+